LVRSVLRGVIKAVQSRHPFKLVNAINVGQKN